MFFEEQVPQLARRSPLVKVRTKLGPFNIHISKLIEAVRHNFTKTKAFSITGVLANTH